MYFTKLEISSCSNLRQACELMNSPQMIDTLLAAGANIDQVFENGSALGISAWRGKTELVRHLLRRGARTGLAGLDGYSDLHKAASRGHSEICKVLVDHGGDIDQKHPITEQTALGMAVMWGQHHTVLTLLSLGADINQRSWLGLTALATATQREDRLAIAVSLLEAGADPNLPDNNGAPPIQKAAQVDNVSVLKLLLEHGCDRDQVYKIQKER